MSIVVRDCDLGKRNRILLADSLGNRPDPLIDLPLRIFLPLERIFRPLPETKRSSLSSYRPLASYAENPLRFFRQSRDLMLMEQILAIGRSIQPGRSQSLLTMSRYFEALSVQYGSLAQTHWNLDEDKLTMNGWSMLGFFFHSKKWLQKINPPLFAELENRLIKGFREDRAFFEDIFSYEKIREQTEYLKIRLCELKIRKFYELCSNPCESFIFIGMSAIANYPQCQKLTELKKREMFSTEEKFEQAEEIWSSLSEGNTLQKKVNVSPEVVKLVQTIKSLERQLPSLKERIQSRGKRVRLNGPKRVLQTLFEYRQLSAAIDATETLFARKEINREGMIQWLILLREGLKMMATDRALNIPELKSAKWIAGAIKEIRDYFEHPEDYALRLDRPDRQEEQVEVLEKALFEDLVKMKPLLLKLLKQRKRGIERFLKPHPSIDPSDAFKTLGERGESPSTKKELIDLDAFHSLRDFHSRIVDLRNKSERRSFRNSLHHPEETFRKRGALSCFRQACREIQEIIPNNRALFLKRLRENVVYRLQIQRRIARAVPLLKRVIREEAYPKTSPYLPSQLENIYLVARENRNLNTHEIWRANPKGIADVAYLLGVDCLSQLNSPPLKEDPFSEKVLQEAVDDQLTEQKLEIYLKKGFDPNYRDYKGRTLIHFLAESPNEENLYLFLFLERLGASIHLADFEGMRPLHYAAESGFFFLAHFLVRYGAVVDAKSERGTPTEIAEHLENQELGAWLVQCRGESRSAGARAMKEAIGRLDVDTVKALLEEGFDAGAEYDGKLPLVSLFSMEEGSIQKQLEIADCLVAAGVDLNQGELLSGRTPLHAAIQHTDDVRVRKWFRRQELDFDRADSRGNTPLHVAARCRRIGWTQELLKRGVQVSPVNCSGNTPLLGATDGYGQKSEIISALLEAGAHPEEEGRFGTALHQAADRGTAESVSLLLERGASPFRLGRGGKYSKVFPIDLARGWAWQSIFSTMGYLFDHIIKEEQIVLEEASRFSSWAPPQEPAHETEQNFLATLYRRRFAWIS